MDTQQKQDFDFVTTQLERIANAAAQPATAQLAGACALRLQAHIKEVLPDMLTTFEAAKVKTWNETKTQMETLGPKLWEQLHTRALSKVQSQIFERSWLMSSFQNQIPCGECKGYFALFVQQNQPDFANYFEWTVALHNSVNAKLKKPLLTLDQSKAIWVK